MEKFPLYYVMNENKNGIKLKQQYEKIRFLITNNKGKWVKYAL